MLHTPPLFTLTIPAARTYLSVATAAVREAALSLAISPPDAEAIVLALEEALVNALEYGFGDPDEMLGVELRYAAQSLEMTVQARCLPLDQEQLPKYDPQRAMQSGDASGLGLLLMKQMMDQVGFSIDGTMRKTVMLKRFSTGLDQPPTRTAKHAPRKNVAIHPRAMRPDDAEDVALLAFRSHGSVFFSESIYYPERIRDMLESGEMHSTVLVADEDVPLGHGALLLHAPGAKVGEMTFAFIDPACRMSGGTTQLTNHLFSQAETLGLHAAYALAVTSHPYSQRPLLKDGFGECLLLLETTPATNQWNRHAEGAPQRIANLGLIRHLVPPGISPLHLPPIHREMIKRIYDHLGRAHAFAEVPSPLHVPDVPSSLEAVADLSEGWSAMEVSTVGVDLPAQLAMHMAEAIPEGIAAIQLCLPLEDPATPWASVRAEELGFFFAGVITGNSGSELLLLQHIPAERTDYQALNVHTDFARELVEYVRSCDPREP